MPRPERPSAGELAANSDVDALARALGHENEKIRVAAVKELAKLGGGEVVEPLIDALYDGRETVVLAAIKALGPSRDGRAVEALARALDEPLTPRRDPYGLAPTRRSTVRIAMINALAALREVADDRPVNALASCLRDPYSVDAGRWGTGDYFDVWWEDIRYPVHDAALSALKRIGTPSAKAALATYHGEKAAEAENERRASAGLAEVMARINSLKAANDLAPIVPMLADGSPIGRSHAEWALEGSTDPAVIDALAGMLVHREPAAVALAAHLLTRVGDPRGSAWVLVDAARRAVSESYDKAAKNLERAGAAAILPLAPWVADPSTAVRWSVARVLGRTGSDEAVPLLAGMLADEDEGVRDAARGSLERIGSPEALRALMPEDGAT